MKITPDENFIQKNFDKTMTLIQKFDPQNLDSLIGDLAERYAMCPASSRKEYFSSFPGGLAYHNLFVFFWMKKFAEIMAPPDKFSMKSLFTVSMLHDMGKLGDKENEYYIPQKSDWHRDRGIYYEINPDIQYMKISQRSLYLAQHYGVSLTRDEYLAILLHDGQHDDSNSSYKYKEPDLATILQYASHWARKKEKENVVSWP